MSGEPRARILVIDDEEDLRNMLEFGLSLRGYQVLQAGDGSEGLVIARNQAVDLVICDIKMPHLDGVETTRLLHRDFPDIPIIVITGLLSEESVEQCRRAGATTWLRKPFSLQELEQLMERIMGGQNG